MKAINIQYYCLFGCFLATITTPFETSQSSSLLFSQSSTKYFDETFAPSSVSKTESATAVANITEVEEITVTQVNDVKVTQTTVQMPTTSWADTGDEESIQTPMTTILANGTLNVLSNMQGNDVRPRAHLLIEGGRKTWLDTQELSSGILTKFFMYIGYVKTSSTSAQIRLQIWRPVSTTDSFIYLLAWDIRVAVSMYYPSGALYMWSLDHNQQFEAKSGDKIGWTCENEYCPISYDNNTDHITQYFESENKIPKRNNPYSFGTVGYGSTWSVAVEIINTGIDETSATTMSTVLWTLTSTPTAIAGLPSLTIVGIAIGCGAVLIICVVIVTGILLTKRRKKCQKKTAASNNQVAEGYEKLKGVMHNRTSKIENQYNSLDDPNKQNNRQSAAEDPYEEIDEVTMSNKHDNSQSAANKYESGQPEMNTENKINQLDINKERENNQINRNNNHTVPRESQSDYLTIII